jgi:hypothetical protein
MAQTDLDVTVEAGFLDQGLGKTNPAGISDLHQMSFHDEHLRDMITL